MKLTDASPGVARSVLATNVQPGSDHVTSLQRPIDLARIPAVTWAWVDERVYAAIRGCSVKALQRERRLNVGCPYRRINGTSIRYKMGDIAAFLESQPGGGGGVNPGSQPSRGAGRPRRSTP